MSGEPLKITVERRTAGENATVTGVTAPEGMTLADMIALLEEGIDILRKQAPVRR